MLTLFEDEAYINKYFKNYLTETKVLDWKYENAVKQILDLGFQPDEVEMDLEKLGAIEEEQKKEKKKTAEKKFGKLPTSEKFAHLAKYYGDDGVLDLQKANIPKRFYKHMRKMKEELGTLLQPLVTLEEREMLVEISKCRNTSEIQKLLTTWYNKDDLTSNCRFIRFALAAGLEIWNSVEIAFIPGFWYFPKKEIPLKSREPDI
ncbi:hypothetical protein [Parasitella parasitica]|uniref:Uncharacterized protein n=1 Tax=Parasitella parasitica TaxID=35722 RepID=A0A0B7MZQ3_9FUNG|nr:hypothetical protein [Parasitella parasitica]